MVTVTSRRATANDPRSRIRELGEEALDIKIKHEPALRRLDEIAEESKAICTEIGEPLKITVVGKGVIKVSPKKESVLRGKLFKLCLDVFMVRPEREQERLLTKGVVKEEEDWSRADYGRFSAEPF